jgi:hypothetical protein
MKVELGAVLNAIVSCFTKSSETEMKPLDAKQKADVKVVDQEPLEGKTDEETKVETGKTQAGTTEEPLTEGFDEGGKPEAKEEHTSDNTDLNNTNADDAVAQADAALKPETNPYTQDKGAGPTEDDSSVVLMSRTRDGAKELPKVAIDLKTLADLQTAVAVKDFDKAAGILLNLEKPAEDAAEDKAIEDVAEKVKGPELTVDEGLEAAKTPEKQEKVLKELREGDDKEKSAAECPEHVEAKAESEADAESETKDPDKEITRLMGLSEDKQAAVKAAIRLTKLATSKRHPPKALTEDRQRLVKLAVQLTKDSATKEAKIPWKTLLGLLAAGGLGYGAYRSGMLDPVLSRLAGQAPEQLNPVLQRLNIGKPYTPASATPMEDVKLDSPTMAALRTFAGDLLGRAGASAAAPFSKRI